MTNFSIEFIYPWLLLLLIPAFVLTFIPYFRVRKQYRRNRNRVVSIVCHTVVMVLCILLLAGITFSYDLPNRENEIILLVDASYSSREEQEGKDEFVENVVNDCGNAYKLGIIKFGYDQLYVAELSTDTRNVYAKYLASEDPDTSATDIAAALTFASKQFTNPQASKIVLISDGIETDETAASVIRAIASTGIKVDVKPFIPDYDNDEVQIIDVETPDYNVKPEDKFNIRVKVKTNLNIEATTPYVKVTMYDNDVKVETDAVRLDSKEKTLDIEHSFTEPGLHKLRFDITKGDMPSPPNGYNDTTAENNSYYTYYYLNVFNKVLIIENKENESAQLQEFLTKNEYEASVVSASVNSDLIPDTLNDLCGYDQVILVNIAYSDMPPGFEEILYEYVHDLGGGLFTVGGECDTGADGKLVPHAYNRDDMAESTLFRQMLPVQVIDYTPPVAVMVVIDTSGSMNEGPGSDLEKAKAGALTCLDVLKNADYCGITTFSSDPTEVSEVIPMSRRNELRTAIKNMENSGAGTTVFAAAIKRAGAALAGVNVQNKHIIMLTDGGASDSFEYDYGPIIKQNRKNGITMSIATTKVPDKPEERAALEEACELGGGKFYYKDSLTQNIYDDLTTYAVADIMYGSQFPVEVTRRTPALSGITNEEFNDVFFTGYYGTLLKNGATETLHGEYGVPLYAQWDVGKGKVGSFMSDLNGKWTGDFLKTDTGRKFINNVITGLFPLEDVKVPEITVTFKDDNYTSQMNVYTTLNEGDTVEVKVTPLTAEAEKYYSEHTMPITVFDGYTRFNISFYVGGVYSVEVIKKDQSGQELTRLSVYKTFSYSEEYDYFPEEEVDGAEFLAMLATNGKGVVLEDSLDIFDSFVKTIHKVVDPRLPFLIIAIVLFLTDVAVRKFKFKWLHEIIRDYKAKKKLEEEEK